MMQDKDLTDDVLDEIIAGAKTSMEQYLALSLKAERANRQQNTQQNITENILVTQFKPVADLYGLTSPTGDETSFTFDAVEARDFIDGGWSCQEYVELGRFQEAMLQGADGKPELTVWYGAMPETNGKTNWTAMLHRKGHHPWEGITIDRSEYPDRVRYEADRMRHLIGELADEPDILAYDAEAHSGYVYPGGSPVVPGGWVACSERMPEENAEQEVLACFKGGDISTLYYFEGRWDDAYGIVPIRQDVTHWMPLPAAPQQEA